FGGGNAGVALVVVGGPAFLLGSLLTLTLGLLLTSAICHGMLRITGETQGGFGRTFSCLSLGYGPWILTAVPFVGPYCLQYPASIWGVISSILILVGGQAVSGVRATFAVLAPVILLMLVGIALVVSLLFGAATAGGPVMPVVPGGFTPPSMVVMEGGVALIGREEVNAMIERVQESTTLPDASTLLGSWSDANRAEPTSFQAGRVDGWWIPGLMVLEGPGGVGILLLDSSTGSERLRVFTEEKTATTATGSTSVRTDGFGEEISRVVVELGGADGDLEGVVDAWAAASTRQGLGDAAKPEPAKTGPAG
ncbi:MAG: hypothetical protein VX672_07485, partial [Planctomycetota bacterium]|nr:hypothetical protein [Planctomycetota bacterium]